MSMSAWVSSLAAAGLVAFALRQLATGKAHLHGSVVDRRDHPRLFAFTNALILFTAAFCAWQAILAARGAELRAGGGQIFFLMLALLWLARAFATGEASLLGGVYTREDRPQVYWISVIIALLLAALFALTAADAARHALG